MLSMPKEKSFIVDLDKENALAAILPRLPLVSSYNSSWQGTRARISTNLCLLKKLGALSYDISAFVLKLINCFHLRL